MNSTLIIIGVLVAIALFLISIFNKFARFRNLVKDAWSNIDVALKKRHDLIPNLVNIVKGYASHEKETFKQVVEARNAAIAAPKDDINAQVKAENQLSQTLKSLFVVVESYPNLKADSSFLNLQSQLGAVEETLERSRRYYNSTVRENNTYGESMPGVLFAGMFKYQHFEYFEADDGDRESVNINL